MKKSHKLNRLILDPNDHSFLNTKEEYIPDNFEYELSDSHIEVVLDYLNRLRVEYISLANNGEPKSKYKPEVREKILKKKTERLFNKERKAQAMLEFSGIKLRDES